MIRMRRARRGDCRDLTRIARAAKRFWGYPEKLLRLWDPDLRITPGFAARHGVYCAVGDGGVVGFYALSGRGPGRELKHMWVDPERIGSGIGRLMFAHSLGRLRRMGVTKLTIVSDPHAEGFYRKLGARRVGKVRSKPAGRTLPVLAFTLPSP